MELPVSEQIGRLEEDLAGCECIGLCFQCIPHFAICLTSHFQQAVWPPSSSVSSYCLKYGQIFPTEFAGFLQNLCNFSHFVLTLTCSPGLRTPQFYACLFYP